MKKKSFFSDILSYLLPLSTLDWLLETDWGNATLYLIATIIPLIIGVISFFAFLLNSSKNGTTFWGSGIVTVTFGFAALVNFLRLLVVILRIIIKKLRRFWESTDPNR